MKLGKNLRKVKIRRRIYSVVLSIMMIANLMYGYTWTTDTSAVKSKKSRGDTDTLQKCIVLW